MHERTQRAVARLVFIFCCAVPTALTVTCVLVTWTPWYHHRMLRSITARLSRNTGLVVEVDDFQRTAPSTLHLYGIRVVHPETGREVARVRELQWISRSDEVSVFLHQPELQSRELPSAWQMIHDRFLCRPEQTSLPVRVAGNDLTIHSVTGALPFQDVDAWIRPHDDAIEATIQCLPAVSPADSPINITARRDRSGEVPTTQWMLDTQGTPLPCSALAEYLPVLESLGSDAMFSGTMRWQLQSSRWWIDLGGSRFDDVSLDRVFEQNSHRLSGTANIQLDRCRIEPHNRRSDIAGSIRAKDGLIGQSLLKSVNKYLGFDVRIPEGMVDTANDIPYDRIAIGFNVNNTQLKLNGICGREVGYEGLLPAGVVLCLGGYPLVQSSDQTLDSLKVITAIAPPHSVLVPLANQTSWMTKVFIPPSRPLPSERFPPRIRSVEKWHASPTIGQPR